MAGKKQTAADTVAKPKRQKGYVATIKAFIPFGEGTAAQIAVLQVIQEMESGDISGLSRLAGATFVVTSKQTSKAVEGVGE